MNEQIEKRRVYDAILREDFHAFVLWAYAVIYPGQRVKNNWHLRLMAGYLEDCYFGRRRRLLVCLPPRHLKSIICSVCFPAWVLGRDPKQRLACVSYAQPASESFAHQTRMLMESAGYKRVFPKTRIDPRRSSKRDIGTTQNGHRLSTSVTGPLTGLGGNFLIIDDPIKADDALSDTVRESVNNWYVSTATSRLDDPKTGRIIVVAQRLHVDDLPGRLLLSGGWDELILPLISNEVQTFKLGDAEITRQPGNILHEDHLGSDEIAQLRKTIPSFLFEAQWNQRPVMAGGNIFKSEWLKYIDYPLERHAFEAVVQSWDTAVMTDEANDYTVCATFGLRGSEIHLLDIYRDRIDHPEQIKRVIAMREKWRADLVVVEASHGGQAIQQHITDPRSVHWLKRVTPRGSKNERAEWQTAKFEQGRVFLPRDASWRTSFETELLAFPKAPHDDQVDAVTQLLQQLGTSNFNSAIYGAKRMAA